MPEEQRQLFSGDQAGKQVDLLALCFEDVNDGKAVDIGVLVVLQLVAEHDRRHRPVGIDQRELASRFARQGGFDDRQDRRNARASGEAQIVAVLVGPQREREPAHRRHRLDYLAGGQIVIGPV